MGKVLTLTVMAAGVLLAATACSSNTCRESISATPEAVFYSSSTQEPVSVDSLTVYGLGVPNDSAIIRNSLSSQVYLPLRGNEEYCRFVFHYEQRALSDPRLNDTLTLHYRPVPKFTSVECGAMYFYEVHDCSCTTNLIDSVRLVNGDVTNVEAETVRVYFRVASVDDEEVAQD